MSTDQVQSLVYKYRLYLGLIMVGLILVILGLTRSELSSFEDGVEIISEDKTQEVSGKIIVEINGAVASPGVYEMQVGSRVNDLINTAGGFKDHDKNWVARFLNRAAPLSDGQKIVIPPKENHLELESASFGGGATDAQEQVLGSQTKYVNINTASKSELESLWGIGPVFAQKIIEHRPYSSVEELLEKGVVRQNVYEKNKDLLTVY